MSHSSSEVFYEKPVEIVMEVQSIPSTVDPPMEEWSSLLIDNRSIINPKRLAYEEGLYDPGSGEVCLKYIAQSDSFVLNHPYTSYPSIKDPGIFRALYHSPDQYIYADDGEELYFATCKDMEICPIGLFYRNIRNTVINLSYYGLHPASIRAMCVALENNIFVREIDLTENFLTDDGCYHLGLLLERNRTIEILNLTGCRIGCSGLIRILPGAIMNKAFRILYLSRNRLDDAGAEAMGDAFERGLQLEELYLSYNNIGATGIAAMTEGMAHNNNIIRLDLSWNNLFTPDGTYDFLCRLRKNSRLEYLNLSWNGMAGVELGSALAKTMAAPKLAHLDISSNKFNGPGIAKVATGFRRAKALVYLDISSNPLSITDVVVFLMKLKLGKSKINTLKMDNIMVDAGIIRTLNTVKSLEEYTHGKIIFSKKPKGPDPREVIIARCNYVIQQKNTECNIALVVMQMVKSGETVKDFKYFGKDVKKITGGALFNEGIVTQLAKSFPGPWSKKTKFINLLTLLDFAKRKHPDAKLPPTPPPEPAPVPKRKGKGKGKKK